MWKYPFKQFLTGALLVSLGLSPLSATSLWMKGRQNEDSMYVPLRAGQVGDILQILVSESITTRNSASTSTSKSSSIGGAVSQFLFTPGAGSNFGTHNGELPAFDLSGGSDHSGSGSISNTQSVTARIPVMVTDVLPNGNLVVEGVRMISFSGETQYVVLKGSVRRRDISADNQVGSQKLLDARVEFLSEGALTAAQRKGLISRFNDWINLF